MKKSTSVNHPPAVDLPAGNRPLVMPIYQSVKFDFETLDDTLEFLRGDRPGFFYSRAANPTTRQLELQLAGMQGRDDCVVTGSGVGAIAQALLALTRQGDHVLCFVETYNPTRYLIRRLLARFGVNSTMLSIEDLAGVERVLGTTPTRLVLFESPTNPVTKVADIEAITRLAQAHGALTLLDNTFAGCTSTGAIRSTFSSTVSPSTPREPEMSWAVPSLRAATSFADCAVSSAPWAGSSIRMPPSSLHGV